MRKVLITGGSGLVGRYLCDYLNNTGWEINVLSRQKSKQSPFSFFYWNLDENVIDKAAFEGVHAIINLAGESIGEKRWTRKQKEKIIQSRQSAVKLLSEHLSNSNHSCRVIIHLSAVGFYGTQTSQNLFSENSIPGKDFTAKVCQSVESIFMESKFHEIRKVILRSGVILSKQGGVLEKINKASQWGVAGRMGSGKQWFPWIHIEDIAGIVLWGLQNETVKGVYNAVAPQSVIYNEFNRVFTQLKRNFQWLPWIPSFVLYAALGKRADLLLRGSRISAHKLQKEGYVFHFPIMQSALKNLLS